ncbi:MAG: hypothetical protein NZL83_01070 [Candidatus Absconditabacterales bacterium]|nr:hypothetical protein [Candidatus Absconditabacterales bacterium]
MGAESMVMFRIDNTNPNITGSGIVIVNGNVAQYDVVLNKFGSIAYSGACGQASGMMITPNLLRLKYLNLANATYNDCSVMIVDLVGNKSDILPIPLFVVNYNPPAPTPVPTPIVCTV